MNETHDMEEDRPDPMATDTSVADRLAEDPLIAALPPNTDYITYLTILEYQLTPKNLATLNRLLQEDDGTLATEIGWDLLKLVLPILRVEPDRARQCLDIIARRGNPREVIVRVAEELETLGYEDSEAEADAEAADDGLPTFAGEAPRVHLGDMKLGGSSRPVEPRIPHDESAQEESGPDAAIEELKLQALLNMLGHLHPRIKTQHPSRFLATSLPAALSAYRRLSMQNDSTSAFLNTLSKLAAKKRPALPPRVSTSDVLNAISSAPLPDPESKTDKVSVSQATADNEAAINQKLAQAVLLEVVDEYIAASSEAQPPLTARLRARFEPQSITSVRSTQLETLSSHPEVERAEKLRTQFVAVAKDLKLDVQSEILKLDEHQDEEVEAEEASDYPTKPSHIPFSTTGLLLLHSAQQYLQATSTSQGASVQPSPLLTTPSLLEAIDRQYENDARLHHSTPAVDSMLSLLYIIFCLPSTSSPSAPQLPAITESETLVIATHNILRDIFTTCPDPDLRDNAHHIASHLLHGYCQRTTRLKIISSLLQSDTAPTTSPIQDAQNGSLKSVAIDWLREEIWPTNAVKAMMNVLDQSERGVNVESVTGLADLVFPTSDIEEPPAPNTTAEQKVEPFAANLPFYVSLLNLICLIATQADAPDHAHEHAVASEAGSKGEPTGPTSDRGANTNVGRRGPPPNLDLLLAKGEAVLAKLETWRDYFVARLSREQAPGSEGQSQSSLEAEGVNLSDVFAFEDAVGRARELLPLHDD